jgi:hypothetical protein
MQNDYKRLVHTFHKSVVANFPPCEIETRENTNDSSATDWHDQSQPLYGMSIDTYPRQPLPPTQIRGKLVDLCTAEPFARERGPSGPMVTSPIFRTELLRPAPELPRPAQTLKNNFEHPRIAPDCLNTSPDSPHTQPNGLRI